MKIIKALLRLVLSGITAFFILCAFFSFYSLVPVHTAKTLGNTDYVWPANSRWCKMNEGIAWGRFDAQGFNNYRVVEDPDILFLGSSHIEATNVMQNESASYLLQKKFGSEKTVYNMGISGHHLAKVLQYLPETLALYTPAPSDVIIEASSLTISPETAEQVLNHTIKPTPSHDKGVIAALQKFPFLRDLYFQLDGGLDKILFPAMRQSSADAAGDQNPRTEPEPEASQSEVSHYDALFSFIRELEETYGTRIIIFYHPSAALQKDGTVRFEQDKYLSAFACKCEENDVVFLDMTDAFYKMYQSEYKLPHGFITGKIGAGHLNADGHRLIADELYQLLTAETEE